MQTRTYVSPQLHISILEVESILCTSLTDATQTFNSLQDYEASEGAW